MNNGMQYIPIIGFIAICIGESGVSYAENRLDSSQMESVTAGVQVSRSETIGSYRAGGSAEGGRANVDLAVGRDYSRARSEASALQVDSAKSKAEVMGIPQPAPFPATNSLQIPSGSRFILKPRSLNLLPAKSLLAGRP